MDLPIVLFWLSIIFSLILSVIGLTKNKTWLVVIGAILFFPFVYYFAGSPATRIIIVLPFLHFGSAYALYKNNKMMAWSLFSPVILFVLFVISIIFANQFGMLEG
jgi:hypothetical protein